MNQDYIIGVDVVDVHKRLEPSKHYVYELKVKWSNNKTFHIYRRYSEFFDFQNKLLNRFENPDGYQHERVLPYLPGKIIFGRSHIKSVALERAKPIETYCETLLSLPPNYSRCNIITEFFRVNDNDVRNYSNQSNSSPATTNLSEISRPVQHRKEYRMIESYRSSYDETSVAKGATVVLVHKSLNGWAAVKLNNEIVYVPYAYMTACDVQDTLDDRMALKTPEEYTVVQSYVASRYDEVSLDRGTRVLVLEKNYSGYWRVRVNDGTGVAPSWCLDMTAPIASSTSEEPVTVQQSESKAFVVNFAHAATPMKKAKPPRPPPPKPSLNSIHETSIVTKASSYAPPIPTTIPKSSDSESNLGIYYAAETYQSPMLSYASLTKGQSVLVTKELNAYEYEIVVDGKTSKAAKTLLEKRQN